MKLSAFPIQWYRQFSYIMHSKSAPIGIIRPVIIVTKKILVKAGKILYFYRPV